jgi:nicotinate phosphoribosyltransferase
VNYFGVGTELVTSRDDPALNGVYKLVAIKKYVVSKDTYNIEYKMKKSSNKVSFPGPKQIYRIIKKNKIYKDILALEDEKIKLGEPVLLQFIKDGRITMKNFPSLKEINEYYEKQMSILPTKFKDLEHTVNSFPVYVSKELKKIIKFL